MARQFESSRILEGNYEKIFNDLLNATSEAKGITLKKHSIQNGHIVADTSFSMVSYGEYIDIYLRQKDGKIEVRIKSELKYPLGFIDYGRDKKNVERIWEAYDKLIKTAGG